MVEIYDALQCLFEGAVEYYTQPFGITIKKHPEVRLWKVGVLLRDLLRYISISGLYIPNPAINWQQETLKWLSPHW